MKSVIINLSASGQPTEAQRVRNRSNRSKMLFGFDFPLFGAQAGEAGSTKNQSRFIYGVPIHKIDMVLCGSPCTQNQSSRIERSTGSSSSCRPSPLLSEYMVPQLLAGTPTCAHSNRYYTAVFSLYPNRIRLSVFIQFFFLLLLLPSQPVSQPGPTPL